MLKNLVKKFTSHTLNDGEDGLLGGAAVAVVNAPPPISSAVRGVAAAGDMRRSNAPPCRHTTRRSAASGVRRMQAPSSLGGKSRSSVPSDPGKDDELNDSGTESDEELAVIETNSLKSVPVSLTSDYYTSQHSLSASCRSSHCGSPSIDQDCVSWDSFGGGDTAQGVWSRNEPAGVTGDLEVELPNHQYHTRQQFRRFLKCKEKELVSSLEQQHETIHEAGTDEDLCHDEQQLASPAVSCGSSVDELESINGASLDGAREKVPPDVEFEQAPGRERSSFVACKGSSQRSRSQNSRAALPAAEKRKWCQVLLADAATVDDFSGATDTKHVLAQAAARRAPVRLLIPLATADECQGGRFVVPVNPSPRKRCKAANVGDDAASDDGGQQRQRPSLNFDKMRQKMKNKSGRKKYGRSGTMAMKSKLRGWNNVGYQLRSSHSECLFQPLKFPPSPSGAVQNAGAGAVAESSMCNC